MISKLFQIGFILISAAALFFMAGCDDDPPTGGGDLYPEGILYVANQTEGSVYRFDVATMTRIDSISSVIGAPHWIEFSPDGQHYYLNGRFPPASMAKFRAVSNTFVDTLTVAGGIAPTATVINSASSIGYVCDFTISNNPGRIHKYNLNTMTFIDSALGNGAASHDLKISSDKSLIVACSRNTDDVTLVYLPQDTVHIIPLNSTNIRPNPPVHGPYGVVIDHNDSLAYIACLFSGQIRIVDLFQRRVIDSIVIPVADNPTFSPSGPTLMAISPDNSTIFVSTQWGNSVVVANTSTGAILADIDFSVGRPFGCKMNTDGSKVFVACVNEADQPGRVYVLDGTTFAKIDSVDVGLNSFSLAWQP